MERVQNQVHVTRATQQAQENMQPDPKLVEVLAEFDIYVNIFMQERVYIPRTVRCAVAVPHSQRE